MDHQRGPAIAENRMLVGTQGDVRRNHGNLCRSVGADHQCEIRYVAGRCSVDMLMSGRGSGKMRASRLEIWWFAFRYLVNVDGMLPGW